jgi:hypothetical protein
LSGRPVERVHGKFPNKVNIQRQAISLAAIQASFTSGPWQNFTASAVASWSLVLSNARIQRLMTATTLHNAALGLLS